MGLPKPLRRCLLPVLLLLTSVTALAQDDCLWATGAKFPFKWQNDEYRGLSVLSPDGRHVIKGGPKGLSITSNKGPSVAIDFLAAPPLTEILWAPDSRSFAINSGDGSGVGAFITAVYTMDGAGQFVRLDLHAVVDALAKHSSCENTMLPNVGISAWLQSGKEFLLLSEAQPSTACGNMGELRGARVETGTGTLLQELPESELRDKWAKQIGCRFKAAAK